VFPLWLKYIKVRGLELWTSHMLGKNWGLLTCDKSVHVKSDKCVIKIYFKWKTPFFSRAIIFMLLNEIRWFKNLMKCWKMSYKLLLDSIINWALTMISNVTFWSSKCSFIILFIIVKDKSNILTFTFWHWIQSLKTVFEIPKYGHFLSFLIK
jgi:hypothetical protein